jgi:hypothetical protein
MRKAFVVPLRVDIKKSSKIGSAKSAKVQSIRKKGVRLPALKFLEKNVEK